MIETNDKRYMRDPHSKALIAVDRRSAEEYRFKSGLVKRNHELEEEVSSMKYELEQIKKLLLEKVNNS